MAVLIQNPPVLEVVHIGLTTQTTTGKEHYKSRTGQCVAFDAVYFVLLGV